MSNSAKENDEIRINQLVSKDYDPAELAKESLELQIATDKDDLSPQVKTFCEEYIIDYKPALAAERAGWNAWNAATIASNLLKNPVVVSKIRELEELASLDRQITRERVIQELGKIAFHNIQDFYDEEGNLKKITEIDRDSAAAISEIKVERRSEGRGEDREFFDLITIKAENKKAALDSLGRYFGIFEADNKIALQLAFSDFLKSLPEEVRNEIKLALMKRINPKKKK